MTKAEAYTLAQRRANATRERFEVFEHVGDYGRPGGDIEAQHTYRVVRAGIEKDSLVERGVWALVAIAEPEADGGRR
jgi:hypothetical protein